VPHPKSFISSHFPFISPQPPTPFTAHSARSFPPISPTAPHFIYGAQCTINYADATEEGADKLQQELEAKWAKEQAEKEAKWEIESERVVKIVG
jgi:hypothetical protein